MDSQLISKRVVWSGLPTKVPGKGRGTLVNNMTSRIKIGEKKVDFRISRECQVEFRVKRN